MGQVFRANDTVLRRKVALKLVLDPDGDSESKARLLREARAAAAIDHAFHDWRPRQNPEALRQKRSRSSRSPGAR